MESPWDKWPITGGSELSGTRLCCKKQKAQYGVHTCNPSYSGDWEDGGSRPAQAKSYRFTFLSGDVDTMQEAEVVKSWSEASPGQNHKILSAK
jgi:hypothetical protein